jgi:hypothetical protein
MLARHAATPANVSQRATAMRRQRRRSTRLYCSTNGCTSFLEPDPQTRIATCPVCGLTRRLH